MRTGAIPRVAAALAAIATLAVAAPADAESHRVAAVDPDDQLVRALEVALSPWGTSVVAVRSAADPADPTDRRPTPGATMPIAVDRARAIARDARALDAAPPFDPAVAAQVALAVKTLLRGTIVAPPPERFGVAPAEPTWIFGASAGVAARLSSSSLPEARLALHASFWPAALRHALHQQWGFELDVEDGTGAHTLGDSFSGSLGDGAVRLALGLRVPFADWAVLEPSLGAAAHLLTLDGVVLAEQASVAVRRVDVAFEPRLGFDFAFLGGRLLVGPWVGATVLGRWQRFFVHDAAVIEAGPVAMEGALQFAVTVP
jgi:hypothetical protein